MEKPIIIDGVDLSTLSSNWNILINILNLYIGEDNYDIQKYPFHENRYYLIIHYDNIEISNDRGTTHNMKDVYIFIRLTSDCLIYEQFRIWRGTITPEELSYGYIFSHATPSEDDFYDLRTNIKNIPVYYYGSTYRYYRFGRVCLGSGHINRTISDLMLRFDETVWQLFLNELDVYIRYEDLQGGPYMKMNIIPKTIFKEAVLMPYAPVSLKSLISDANLFKSLMKSLIMDALNMIDIAPLNTKYSSDISFSFDMNDLEKVLTARLLRETIKYYQPINLEKHKQWLESKKILVIKQNDHYYVEESTSPSSLTRYCQEEIVVNTGFSFKGKPVSFKILAALPPPDNNKSILNCVVINPTITSYVLGFVKIYGLTGLLESPLYNNPIQDEN